MSSPRPSWRPLLAGTVGLFLIILAFLAGQLRAGGDPALGRSNAATQQATEQRQAPQETAPSAPFGGGQGTDPSAPDSGGQGTDPSAPDSGGGQGADPSAPDSGGGQDPSAGDGFVPGGSDPAPPVPDGSSQSSDAPSTHQS